MATVPEAKDALNRFKMEAASEVGVHSHLKNSKTDRFKPNFNTGKNRTAGVQLHQKPQKTDT